MGREKKSDANWSLAITDLSSIRWLLAGPLLETVTESESGTLLVSFGLASIRLSGAGSLAPARDWESSPDSSLSSPTFPRLDSIESKIIESCPALLISFKLQLKRETNVSLLLSDFEGRLHSSFSQRGKEPRGMCCSVLRSVAARQ